MFLPCPRFFFFSSVDWWSPMDFPYLSRNGLAIKVQGELFPPVLVYLDFDHLSILLASEGDLDIHWGREAKEILCEKRATVY